MHSSQLGRGGGQLNELFISVLKFPDPVLRRLNWFLLDPRSPEVMGGIAKTLFSCSAWDGQTWRMSALFLLMSYKLYLLSTVP